MTPSPKSKVLPPIRIDDELYEHLLAEAARRGHTVSSLVRHLLTQALERPSS